MAKNKKVKIVSEGRAARLTLSVSIHERATVSDALMGNVRTTNPEGDERQRAPPGTLGFVCTPGEPCIWITAVFKSNLI